MAAGLSHQYELNIRPGPLFEDEADAPRTPLPAPVRLLAFYLPQFHAIPENDRWWGKGFTEWTNATKTLPRFQGHYQPHLPNGLGFYDQSEIKTIARQANLARKYGVSGFCIYYYWFGGKKVLESPLEALLKNPEVDLPFCLCWANENWTRTWNGSNRDVLLAQDHSAEDDLAFARSIEPALRDPRYIRIDGRPVLMLYRPALLPDPPATVARWREHFRSVGLGDPYIAMVQSFDDADPRPYGMDAAVGFPPHGVMDDPQSVPRRLRYDRGFTGKVIPYDTMVARIAARRPTEYRFMPGVCVAWDNDARRPGRGLTFTGSTPAKYGDWLTSACRYAMDHNPPDQRFVFINAWNEWAEGAHLEPDRHFGYAYLAETSRVLNDLGDERKVHARVSNLPAAPVIGPVVRARKSVRRVLGRMKRKLISALNKGTAGDA